MTGLPSNSTTVVSGYVEGYYGRLLSWAERESILEVLAETGFNSYFYGPKDDAKHRVAWREPYDADWRRSFRQFTTRAEQLGISVIAGVAPGLDFDFSGMSSEQGDLALLCAKSEQLLADGAAAIALMMDDIDNDFHTRCGDFTSEGEAHATLANHLLSLTGNHNPVQPALPSVFCVPRIYANELLANNDLTMPAVPTRQIPAQPMGTEKISNKENAEPQDYMRSFTSSLDKKISWLYCGRHVVSSQPEAIHCQEIGASMAHKIVIWDNYYANDYCPRRLFLGAWQGRHSCEHLLLNGTGLPHTDCLLLCIVAATRSASQSSQQSNQELATSIDSVWRECLHSAAVPDEFFQLYSYFNHPVFSDAAPEQALSETAAMRDTGVSAERQIAAIDRLLWSWKAPLASEWYPYLFGLKQDLQMVTGSLPELRIRKTQTPVLAEHLIRHTPPTEH